MIGKPWRCACGRAASEHPKGEVTAECLGAAPAPCANCGHPKKDHWLVYYENASPYSAMVPVCPTAVFQEKGDQT